MFEELTLVTGSKSHKKQDKQTTRKESFQRGLACSPHRHRT